MGALEAAPLFFFLLLAAPVQDPFPGEEGDLENRTILPAVGEEIERLLAEGDRERDRGRYETTFERWTLALVRSRGATGLVAVDDRLRVGPREAVARRLASLDREGRAAHRAIVEAAAAPIAESVRDDEEALRELADRHPGSLALARITLRLGDRLLERGEPVAAVGAYREAAACGDPDLVEASLARRAFVAARLRDEAGFEGIARAIDPRASVEIAGESVRGVDWIERLRGEAAFASGPAGAELVPAWRTSLPREMKLSTLSSEPTADGPLVFVQTESYVHVLDLESGRLVDRVELAKLGADESDDGKLRRVRPAARGGLLAVVHGTPKPPHGFNALALFERDRSAESAPFRLRWRRIGSSWFPPGGEERTESPLAGFVFTPTPLLLGERVYVGAQRIDSEVSSYLLSFDVRDGALRFARPICTGSPLGETTLRAGYRGVNVSGTGPIAADGVLFYGTSLGVVAAVEADDGECLFAYRTARRVPEGIPGARSSDAFAGPLGFAILPSDSSFLYEFARPDPGSPRPDSVLLHPPASVPDALRFAGRNDRRQVFLVASGRDETAAALDTGRGGRIESAPLGPDESFVFRGDRLHERFVRAPALASGKLFAASDRYLYALDLRRDLLLEGATHPPLDPATGLFEDGKVVFGHLLAVPGGILSVTPSAVVLFRDPAR